MTWKLYFSRATDTALALFDLLSQAGNGYHLAPGTLIKAGNSGHFAIEEAVKAFEELAKMHRWEVRNRGNV